ncbi:hypothetical protein B9Z55_014170 [Caenorhabditis nigoni]|uniref:Tudor domain-containing protein n=1 Tax=Caenorhabditis nigoni TaxID=1611254 RepID=A0A2G5U4T1_9PELO|nr:hypothetical protein B9Z55_014170 [Caenorhabditis nigoni]
MSGNLRYEEGLVTLYSNKSEAFYAYSNRFSKDIIIDSQYGFEDIVGKWVRMGIDQRLRVREKVEIIDDIFPTRICRRQVEVRVRMRHDGRTDRNMEMFKNDYFGYICDFKGVLNDVQDKAEYDLWIIRFKEDRLNSQWQVSTEQDSIQPLSASNSRQFDNFSPRLTKMKGVVTGYSRRGGFYLAWSDSDQTSTCVLEHDFCPSNTPMLGQWIEFEADHKKRVQKPVNIVRELFETKVANGLAEFYVVFQYIKSYKNDCELFHTEHFGMIWDSYGVVERIEKDAWYRGWIQYEQNFDKKFFWTFSLRQTVDGPYRYRPDSLPSRRGSSDSDRYQISTNRRWSPVSMNNMDRGTNQEALNRNRIPDNDDSYERNSYQSRRHDSGYVPSGIPFVDNREPQSSRTSSSSISRRRSPSPHASCSTNTSRSEPRKNYDENVKQYIPTDRDETKVNRSEKEYTKKISSEEVKEMKQDFPQKPNKNTRKESFDATVDGADKSSNTVDASLKDKFEILKQKNSRICALVKSLTKDESVSFSMQIWSHEDYEELLSLVNSTDE